MSFFNKIGNSIAKGIGEAVSKAAENAIAPAAEKLSNKIAESLNKTTQEIEENEPEVKSSFKQALERLETAAKNYEATMENLEKEFGNDDVNPDCVAILSFFPKWPYQPAKVSDGDMTDEYVLVRLAVEPTQQQVDDYRALCVENGFTKTDQIQRKYMGEKELAIDYTFSVDGEITYCIYKEHQNW